MRALKYLIVIPALVLVVASCGPRRPCMSHHGEPCHGGGGAMMMGGCGPESCVYRGRCFSSGAVNSSSGVCQACSAGKWVATSGCSEPCEGHGRPCDGMKGKKDGKGAPCHHHGGHSQGQKR